MAFLAVFLLVCVICIPLFCWFCCACYIGCLCGWATVTVCSSGFPQPASPIYLLFPLCLPLPLVFWSSVVVPVGALRLLVFFCLLSACCAVCLCRGGVSCGVVMLCRRCPCLLSLLNASSPKGASAHVMHAALFLSLCPLASCPVMVVARMLVCLCATCARARWCCDCGGWPLLVSFRSVAPLAQTPDLCCCCFPLPCG